MQLAVFGFPEASVPGVPKFCNHGYDESITISKLTSGQLYQPTIKYLEGAQIVKEEERDYILKEMRYMEIGRSINLFFSNHGIELIDSGKDIIKSSKNYGKALYWYIKA